MAGLDGGTLATGPGRGDRRQGDATLTYRLDTAMVDAAFTDIKNIDRLGARSVSTAGVSDVPVDGQGEFQSGLTGNRIQGVFYGPGHGEAAGVFQQSGMVGAFGAKGQ